MVIEGLRILARYAPDLEVCGDELKTLWACSESGRLVLSEISADDAEDLADFGWTYEEEHHQAGEHVWEKYR